MVERMSEHDRQQPAGSFRGGWLVLTTGGPAASLAGHDSPIAIDRIRVVTEGAEFARVLVEGRPRIAVLAAPPAGADELRLAVAERLRRSSLRIVHLAPPDAVDERLAALALGFDESLPTSISGAELAARLTLLEGRARDARASGSHSLLVAEDVFLDLVAHDLRRDGTHVHLRPKEFRLLEVLASHPGRVYTRRQLLDRVWGPEHESGPRTVDVHVRWLRAKLETDPERPVHLVTVHGIGYRLDPPAR